MDYGISDLKKIDKGLGRVLSDVYVVCLRDERETTDSRGFCSIMVAPRYHARSIEGGEILRDGKVYLDGKYIGVIERNLEYGVSSDSSPREDEVMKMCSLLLDGVFGEKELDSIIGC